MKKLLSCFAIAALTMAATTATAQVSVGITTPDASAQLDITATGKGLLVPRMTNANLPASPAVGLIVYQTDGTPGFYYYNGTAWLMLSTAPAFNDTLTRNLYTSGHLLSADGTTGISMGSNGQIIDAGTNYHGSDFPSLGAGTRMMWNPGSSAFRVGYVDGSEWDGANVGAYSIAMGVGTIASGDASTAFGSGTTASGPGSTAMGTATTASADVATAMGASTTASGVASTAMGQTTTASGDFSTAMGSYVSTSNQSGSFAIGDGTYEPTVTSNDAPNQMMMRFSGGYKLYTNGGATQGVLLNSNGVIEYINDVAASYDSRALTDKNYVDSDIAANVFNDTLTRNLYTSGHLLSADGTTGISMGSNGQIIDAGTNYHGSAFPSLGAGTRMMWNPGSSAFRVGYVDGSEWDGANVGAYSIAMGVGTIASGDASTAFGSGTTASGPGSTAMGTATTASADVATAMGASTTASGVASTAMGQTTTASGDFSTAMGSYVSTSSQSGSFAIGDGTYEPTVTSNDAPNQMMMRFSGGYKLYTNGDASVGVQVAAGGNSWSTISDRRKKENFAPVDGEVVLVKIRQFPLSSWNYKGQDPKSFRHYGPMAQDFFAAFGEDSYGTSGNDTTISQADMEGVSFIAIQALEKRTQQLQEENETLKEKFMAQANETETLKTENKMLKQKQSLLNDRIDNIESVLNSQAAKASVTAR